MESARVIDVDCPRRESGTHAHNQVESKVLMNFFEFR